MFCECICIHFTPYPFHQRADDDDDDADWFMTNAHLIRVRSISTDIRFEHVEHYAAAVVVKCVGLSILSNLVRRSTARTCAGLDCPALSPAGQPDGPSSFDIYIYMVNV